MVLDVAALVTELARPLTFSRGGMQHTTRSPLRIAVEQAWLEPYQRRGSIGGFSAAIAVDLDEGKHRQIRRIVYRAGLKVKALHRRRVAGVLSVDGLAPGEARWLAEAEIAALYSTVNAVMSHPPNSN